MNTPDEIKWRLAQEAMPRAERESSYHSEFEWQRVQVMRSLDVDDVFNEIDDDVVEAIKVGDPNAVGRLVLAKINAWADRVAHQMVRVL